MTTEPRRDPTTTIRSAARHAEPFPLEALEPLEHADTCRCRWPIATDAGGNPGTDDLWCARCLGPFPYLTTREWILRTVLGRR